MSDPDWADTPTESVVYLAAFDDRADVRRDQAHNDVDQPTSRPLCGCRLPVHDPYCWGPSFVAAYLAANPRSAA